MPPLMTINADTAPIRQTLLSALPAAVQAHVNAACEQTAEAIVREAKARLSRQLKGDSVPTAGRPDLGQNLTVEGIHAVPAYDGNGWVVLSDREPFPNVTLWLEKGTRAGKRRNFAHTPAEPYFYASIALEAGNHERRIDTAMHDAAAETGLGG